MTAHFPEYYILSVMIVRASLSLEGWKKTYFNGDDFRIPQMKESVLSSAAKILRKTGMKLAPQALVPFTWPLKPQNAGL